MTDPALILSFRNSLRACTDCPLHVVTTPVPWHGPIDPDICVIGEAPGRSEAKEGEPFVGPAGQRLKQLLRQAGIDPRTVAFTNACQCYPADEKTPNDLHINACRKWMRGQVAFINPRFVITVGVVAFQSVRGHHTWPKLQALHGKPMYWDNPPAPAKPILWPTYHPSAALRSAKYHRLIEDDLAAFVKWRDGGELWPEDCWICEEELYRYDHFGIGLCRRHSTRQGQLFPEDAVVSSSPA